MKFDKVLITGSNGFIGRELVNLFQNDKKYNLFTLNRNQLDLLNEENVDTFFKNSENKFDIVGDVTKSPFFPKGILFV